MFKHKVIVGVLLGALLVTAGCGTAATQSGNSSSSPSTNSASSPTQASSSQESSSAATVAQGTANQGKPVFDTNCASCHSIDDKKIVGPGLKGIYSKSKLPNGQDLNDANMVQWIKTGDNQMPGNPALSEADLANITAYLKTLK